ncbi:MAG TPA: amidase, partial [Candidatus Acidoferrum sp.]
MSANQNLCNVSATTLTRLIRTKKASAEDVITAHIERVTEVNPRLNAVVQLCLERALDEARAADTQLASGTSTGPLHGVPFTIKDSFGTEGVISTGGTKGRTAFVPSEDATVVGRLRAAGGILLGKTNTSELTMAFE